MEGYRYLDHTADVEFVAYADDFDDLFENALLAMFDTIADIKKVAKDPGTIQRIKIEAKSSDTTGLVWETLQQALSKVEAEGLFAYKVEKPFYKFYRKEYLFFAECLAKPKKPALSKLEVKGVSKFDLKFRESGIDYTDKSHNFEVSVVLDV